MSATRVQTARGATRQRGAAGLSLTPPTGGGETPELKNSVLEKRVERREV